MTKNNHPGKKKYVYLFSQLDMAEAASEGDREAVRGLLGGKGAGLAEMTRMDIPVPPGFTVTTEACKLYIDSGELLPEFVWDEITNTLHSLELITGKVFGDTKNPLLVSCRSGAKFSMPGMMDTVLNIGLNDQVVQGLISQTSNTSFVYDSYRRFLQMFACVVFGMPEKPFDDHISFIRKKHRSDSKEAVTVDDGKEIVAKFKEIIRRHIGHEFPTNPLTQLRLATEAVFRSSRGHRATIYREAAAIPQDIGTAVNIVAMVFGNMGSDSATGVAMSRNASTGERELEGDYLPNAQGEDVVSGTQHTKPISDLKLEMPEAFEELEAVSAKLETHFRDMQDIEFTIERGKLWLLQTRRAKRTAMAAIRVAVDMSDKGLITREEAVRRIKPEQIDFFLHPQFDASTLRASKSIATGLNVSPGAAVGIAAFDADTAQRWAKEDGRPVVMVRPETKPEDVHGMLAAEGILTSRGGRTSHAALVARQFGKPAIIGCSEVKIDLKARQMMVGEMVISEGDWISVDGTHGDLYIGQLPTITPDMSNPYLLTLLGWSDEIRKLEVWANADNPQDAIRARQNGAEGIGLCRTEHMFFGPDRLGHVQEMIMADTVTSRKEALDKLLPMQRADFDGLFRAMDGLPVIIRLLDPPLHEFLPPFDELVKDLADLKVRMRHCRTLSEIDEALDQIRVKENYRERLINLREDNPMLGTRGVRLGILYPEITTMQVRAIIEAACECANDGIDVKPEIMIPLAAHVNELRIQRQLLDTEAQEVMKNYPITVTYKFGTMIEIPRAALTADEIAEITDFFSFGTNDLTQTTYGISRDDAESSFLVSYLQQNILTDNPFATIDSQGVGKLMKLAVTAGRKTRPDLEIGICGEHGGDPKSIRLCHNLGLDYVSCSAFRVPVARLAAAHATMN